MPIDLTEEIIATLRTRLEDNLPYYIDVINGEKNDGITLAHPAQVLDYIPPANYLTAFPTIGIGEGVYHLDDDTGWGGTGRAQIIIVPYIQSYDQVHLVALLRRMTRACVQAALGTTRTFGDAWGVKLVRVDPGPTLGRNEEPRDYMSMTAITLEVKFEQSST